MRDNAKAVFKPKVKPARSRKARCETPSPGKGNQETTDADHGDSQAQTTALKGLENSFGCFAKVVGIGFGMWITPKLLNVGETSLPPFYENIKHSVVAMFDGFTNRKISGFWSREIGADNALVGLVVEYEFQSNGTVRLQTKIRARREVSNIYSEGTYEMHGQKITAKLGSTTVDGFLSDEEGGEHRWGSRTVELTLEPNGDMIENGDANQPGSRLTPARASY